MTHSVGANPKPFRRARLGWAFLLALVLGSAVATFMTFDRRGRAFELEVSDAFRSAAALPDDPPGREAVPITLILIDDGALGEFGHWPWPWTRLADIVDTLADLEARLIVMDIEFPEPDRPEVVESTSPDGRREEKIVQTVPRLVESIRAAGNVLLPFSLYFKGRGEGGGRPPETAGHLPPALARHAVALSPGAPHQLLPVEGYQPMIAPLA
ncbi:MAG TPA: CHASE2 domain-containing protein, partial [Phycisphaerae bacterium]|nr:CHASE2 domain-containing protein [Phycisphaerae bacterium]